MLACQYFFNANLASSSHFFGTKNLTLTSVIHNCHTLMDRMMIHHICGAKCSVGFHAYNLFVCLSDLELKHLSKYLKVLGCILRQIGHIQLV